MNSYIVIHTYKYTVEMEIKAKNQREALQKSLKQKVYHNPDDRLISYAVVNGKDIIGGTSC